MKRARDFGIEIGRFPTGPNNAITDVNAVAVGHHTLNYDQPSVARTGVTVIYPNFGSLFKERVVGSAFVLNGAGELSGITQVCEWGVIETPIALTNTMSVGIASQGIINYMMSKHHQIGDEDDVIIPVVGECDDSWLNDVSGRHLSTLHVEQAIENCQPGPVQEGCVGAGTGMITCDLKSGIGTSSRVVNIADENYTLGVLVLSNFGSLEQLRIDGFPFGRYLQERNFLQDRRRVNYGSIICVVATDAPLTPHQLGRVAKRAALGIGRCGSTANHGSGEIILCFSTKNTIPRGLDIEKTSWTILMDRLLNPLYEATIDATEESIINSLVTAQTTQGRYHRQSPSIPLDLLEDYLMRQQLVG